jgi:hypothetical protein
LGEIRHHGLGCLGLDHAYILGGDCRGRRGGAGAKDQTQGNNEYTYADNLGIEDRSHDHPF